MMNPEMYAAMIGSVLHHTKGHLEEAFRLCEGINDDFAGIPERLEAVEELKVELQVIRSDMDRALLYFGIDDQISGGATHENNEG
jgi:hypothetical protein